MIWDPKELNTAKSWHLYHVFHDDDFLNQINKNLTLEQKQHLASEFDIKLADINFYIISNILPMKIPQYEDSALSMDLEKGRYILTFDARVQVTELQKRIKEFDRIRTMFGISPRKNKKKPPEKTDLLYAIFKARKRGLTFGDIFFLYEKRKLPGYTKAPAYTSLESFEYFYNTHKPRV